jgi:hypothetical protein
VDAPARQELHHAGTSPSQDFNCSSSSSNSNNSSNISNNTIPHLPLDCTSSASEAYSTPANMPSISQL